LRGDERAIHSVEFFYARGRWGYGRGPRVRLYGICACAVGWTAKRIEDRRSRIE